MAGLHGCAENTAHGVTVYLLPGLTVRQRRAVLRRLRQEASRGFGPALPLPALLIALGRDRLRAAAAPVVAIIRLHPAAALLPGAAAAVMALFVLASTGGVTGPAPGTGPYGVAVSSGRLAAAESGGSGVISTAIATGGSELGSGVPATAWQAGPQRARRHHRHVRRGARHVRLRAVHGHRAAHQRHRRGAAGHALA